MEEPNPILKEFKNTVEDGTEVDDKIEESMEDLAEIDKNLRGGF